MKKCKILILAALSLALYSCGGGGSSDNPNNAVSEFSNPTGTLSASNANDVGQSSLDASSSSGASSTVFLANKPTSSNVFDKYSNKTLGGGNFQQCINTQGQSSTIDWECAAPLFDADCTGDGTTVSTLHDEDEFTTIKYNNFNLNCTGDARFDFTCNGTINTSIDPDNAGYYCGDLSCRFNTFNTTFDGCVSPDGSFLIRVAGRSFVVEEITTDGICSTVTTKIRDSVGNRTITCNVSKKEDACATLTDVRGVDDCTISSD